jgi:hypothetical protein
VRQLHDWSLLTLTFVLPAPPREPLGAPTWLRASVKCNLPELTQQHRCGRNTSEGAASQVRFHHALQYCHGKWTEYGKQLAPGRWVQRDGNRQLIVHSVTHRHSLLLYCIQENLGCPFKEGHSFLETSKGSPLTTTVSSTSKGSPLTTTASSATPSSICRGIVMRSVSCAWQTRKVYVVGFKSS